MRRFCALFLAGLLLLLPGPAYACSYPPASTIAKYKSRFEKNLQDDEVIVEVDAVGMRGYGHNASNSKGITSIHMIVRDGGGFLPDGSQIEYGLKRHDALRRSSCPFVLYDSPSQFHEDSSDPSRIFIRGFIKINKIKTNQLFGSGLLYVQFPVKTDEPMQEIIWQDYAFRKRDDGEASLYRQNSQLSGPVPDDWVRVFDTSRRTRGTVE